MNVYKELFAIRELLGISQVELSKKLDVSYETINRWENEKCDCEDYNVEKIYSFAYENGIHINEIFEQLNRESEDEDSKIIFHGSKKSLEFPINLKHSKLTNDFGIGFYCGENFEQASTYISNSSSTNVYSFKLSIKNLSIVKFTVSKEWMLAICYYRGWINDFKDSTIIKKIVEEIESADIIVAPIADNRMFDLISEFVRGEITDSQCEHALSATNLGMQYVLKTKKSLDNLELIKLFHLSKKEKEYILKKRIKMNETSQQKVKFARIEYRGKGQYIDELLK